MEQSQPLIGVQDDKEQPSRNRSQKPTYGSFDPRFLGTLHRHDHGQGAGEQTERHHRGQENAGSFKGSGPVFSGNPHITVSDHQSRKSQRIGDEKKPHPQFI